MSIFICAACGGYADSDDGCEEVAGRLVCIDCDQDRAAASDGDADPINLEEPNGTH